MLSPTVQAAANADDSSLMSRGAVPVVSSSWVDLINEGEMVRPYILTMPLREVMVLSNLLGSMPPGFESRGISLMITSAVTLFAMVVLELPISILPPQKTIISPVLNRVLESGLKESLPPGYIPEDNATAF